MGRTSDPVVIFPPPATPLGRFLGELSPFSAHELGSHVIGAAVERAKCHPIGSTKCSWDACSRLDRARRRRAGRARRQTAGRDVRRTINKVCGSGMKATMLAA